MNLKDIKKGMRVRSSLGIEYTVIRVDKLGKYKIAVQSVKSGLIDRFNASSLTLIK